MTFTERHFYTMLVISLLIHVVFFSSLISKPDVEKEDDFKELRIKLGVKKVQVADARSGYFHDIQQEITKPSVSQNSQNNSRKIVHQKIEKQEEKNPQVAKIEEVEKGSFSKAGEKTTTSLLSPKKPEETSEDVKEGREEVVRVLEKTARKMIATSERAIAAPKPVVRNVEREKEGYILGNSFLKDADELLTYEQMLPLWLEQFKIYPEQARILNLEGDGVVRIMIKRDGRVLRKEIEKTTGHEILDKALIQMIDDADPVIPVPDDYLPERKSFSYRVPFEMRNN